MKSYNERVLLLGDPGAGKTTTLMAYAREAVARRLENDSQPLPFLVHASDWDPQKALGLLEWVVNLTFDTDTRELVIREIHDKGALFIIDALDELGSEAVIEVEIKEDLHSEKSTPVKQIIDPRSYFLEQALNDLHFSDHYRILLTCRLREYERIGHRALLNGAVTLVPLSDKQIEEYLQGYPYLGSAPE